MSWLIDAAELLAEPDPGPTPWLVESLIVDRSLAAMVGRWKTTKSYALLDVCISIASGEPAFGMFRIPEPGPVVFVNEESGRAALWRRLDALCRGRAVDPESLRGRLYVAANARLKLDDPRWQEELLELGARLTPRLFAFDPLARMKAPARNENAQEEMAGIIEYLRHLREESGAAVSFVHHTGHNGEHMRGSSDLETAWETRLRWKREDQASVVTIESEHRDAEPATFEYRIVWDGLTRSMRFEPVEDELRAKVREYLVEHPDASANAVFEVVGGNRPKVLALVRECREQVVPEAGYHLGTTPQKSGESGVVPGTPFPLGKGGSSRHPLALVPGDGYHPLEEGDDDIAF